MKFSSFVTRVVLCAFTLIPCQLFSANYSEISAAPNPCVNGLSALCETTISWQVADPGTVTAQIFVSANGGPEKLFACNRSFKAAKVPWIKKGRIYEFRLYETESCDTPPNEPYVASVSVTGVQASPTAPQRNIGMTKFDLALAFFGRAFRGGGSEAYAEVGRAYAEKAIADARQMGARFIRFFASGWGPQYYDAPVRKNDLVLWQSDPNSYWRRMDEVMDMLDEYGVRAAPMLAVNIVQMPSLTHETVRDLITNRQSASYHLLKKYIGEFVNRYKYRDTIAFYDLTGEFNSRADIDLLRTCENTSGAGNVRCQPLSENFTTAEMIGFSTNLASNIRTLDSTRLISTGYTLPRRSAEHLREKPQWQRLAGSWDEDSLEEFKKNLQDTQQGFDILSVHFYNVPSKKTGVRNNERFGFSGTTNVGILSIIREAASEVGKKFWVGEFGDVAPYIKDDPQALFSQAILEQITTGGVDYLSPHALQIYVTNLR